MKKTKKDTRLTFRVDSDLKAKLEAIAAQEGRSVAQVSEAFLRAGCVGYKQDGSQYLQRFISRQRR